MKKLSELSAAEYQALARKMDRRYGPEVAWDNIPGRRIRGRPRTGSQREPLEGHLIMLTRSDWLSLQRKAKKHQASVSEFVRALARA